MRRRSAQLPLTEAFFHVAEYKHAVGILSDVRRGNHPNAMGNPLDRI
jgi:hypothetical protein